MLYSLLASLKSLVKFQTVNIDNSVFRLHYRLTTLLLAAFCLVLKGNEYFGEPILCYLDSKAVPEKIMNTFCWSEATFSVEEAWKEEVGVDGIAYPGVDKYVRGKNTKIVHAYYQWVGLVLFLQALLFYIPRYLWKSSEGGRIKSMVQNLQGPIIRQEEKGAGIDLLVNCMIANLNNNGAYALRFFVCEVLNAVNVIGQMYLMDKFLGGTFSSYGVDVIRFTEWAYEVRYDPMIRVFPRVTKCTFHDSGFGGDVQKHDALCVLPLNIMNEKIFVFLWFWFVLMSVLSCMAVAYRILLFASQEARLGCLKARASVVNESILQTVVRKCKVGDWFLLHLLSKNINPLHFKDFIDEFARRLDDKCNDS